MDMYIVNWLLTVLRDMQDCESDEIPHEHKKLGEGSPQPGKTMGSPGTLPLWEGHP